MCKDVRLAVRMLALLRRARWNVISSENEKLMMKVTAVLDGAGFHYAISTGSQRRTGYKIIELSGLAIGVTNNCGGEEFLYSSGMEQVLVAAGLTVTRPFADMCILRVSKTVEGEKKKTP